MKTIKQLTTLFFFVIGSTIASANGLTIKQLNELVEQTNFIVNRGCSGTLIDLKNKLILTNYHCIDTNIEIVEKEISNIDGIVKKVKMKKYKDVPVVQNGYDGFTKVSTSTYIAEIVAENKAVDLAVLKIKTDLPQKKASIILPDNLTILRGEDVYAVGNPGGMDATIVKGIISNMNRTFEFPWTNEEKLPMIQFSGGIYGGNSGGALYNNQGYLIGVPAAGFRGASFIGLAIPISIVKKFLKNNCLAEAYDDTFSNTKCIDEKKKKEKKAKSED